MMKDYNFYAPYVAKGSYDNGIYLYAIVMLCKGEKKRLVKQTWGHAWMGTKHHKSKPILESHALKNHYTG